MTISKHIGEGFGSGELYTELTTLETAINAIEADMAGLAYGATITVGNETADVINVGIQLTDIDGNNLAVPTYIRAYFCTTSAGTTKETTTVTTETAIGTDGEILVVTAKTEYMLLSEADGHIDIDITDTGTNDTYLAIVLPTGKIVVSDNIKFTA